MKCDDGGCDISGTYFETDGKTICKECYDKVQNNVQGIPYEWDEFQRGIMMEF